MARLLCRCLVVEEREVLASIRAGARSVEEVGRACDAGTGCQSCRLAIVSMLRREAQRRAADRASDGLQLSLF